MSREPDELLLPSRHPQSEEPQPLSLPPKLKLPCPRQMPTEIEVPPLLELPPPLTVLPRPEENPTRTPGRTVSLLQAMSHEDESPSKSRGGIGMDTQLTMRDLLF